MADTVIDRLSVEVEARLGKLDAGLKQAETKLRETGHRGGQVLSDGVGGGAQAAGRHIESMAMRLGTVLMAARLVERGFEAVGRVIAETGNKWAAVAREIQQGVPVVGGIAGGILDITDSLAGRQSFSGQMAESAGVTAQVAAAQKRLDARRAADRATFDSMTANLNKSRALRGLEGEALEKAQLQLSLDADMVKIKSLLIDKQAAYTLGVEAAIAAEIRWGEIDRKYSEARRADRDKQEADWAAVKARQDAAAEGEVADLTSAWMKFRSRGSGAAYGRQVDTRYGSAGGLAQTPLKIAGQDEVISFLKKISENTRDGGVARAG